MGESEGLASKVCYPVTELVVTRHDKAAIFAVKVTIKNRAWHPSQYLGRSGGSRPHHRKRALRHSWPPRSVLLTVEGSTVSQAPVFVAHCILHACNTGGPSSAAVSASSARLFPRILTAV